MALANSELIDKPGPMRTLQGGNLKQTRPDASAVSWGAILAGAVAAAALPTSAIGSIIGVGVEAGAAMASGITKTGWRNNMVAWS